MRQGPGLVTGAGHKTTGKKKKTTQRAGLVKGLRGGVEWAEQGRGKEPVNAAQVMGWGEWERGGGMGRARSGCVGHEKGLGLLEGVTGQSTMDFKEGKIL